MSHERMDSGTRARRRAVAICGTGSPGPEVVPLAEELGRIVVAAGFNLVCGGMGGVMEAAARGGWRARALGAAGSVIGILPTERLDSGNPYCDVVIPTGMGIARNALVVRAADVVVLVGGGAGTLSEAAYAWQLDKPLIALESSGGWAARLADQVVDDRRNDRIHRAASPADVLVLALEAVDGGCV